MTERENNKSAPIYINKANLPKFETGNDRYKKSNRPIRIIALFVVSIILVVFVFHIKLNNKFDIGNIPEYKGIPYYEINSNKPFFTEEEKSLGEFETYEELDRLGRCGVAFANLSEKMMPDYEREAISSITPTGWVNKKYPFIDGDYLYNRCHLIGFQLTGQNANEKNLITGTRYFNVEGMLPFENRVANYLWLSNNHVLYRVTPIFKGNNLVASGVEIEAWSIEDNGENICFNVFVYNVQPGIKINYMTGESTIE